MTLAEELVAKVYSVMPAAMAYNSVFALALVNEALERAAQECEKMQQSETCCAERIRALKD